MWDARRRLLLVMASLLAVAGALAASSRSGADERVAVGTGPDTRGHREAAQEERPTTTEAIGETPGPSVNTTTTSVAVTTPVRPDGPDDHPECIDPTSYHVTPGGGVCEEKPAILDGRVVDTTGAGVADVCLYSIPLGLADGAPSLRTDGDGAFHAVNLVGSFIVKECPGTVYEFGWEDKWIHEQPSRHGESHRIEVTLTELGGIRGRVVDTTGQPVAGVCPDVVTEEEMTPVLTGADGRFAITGARPGPNGVGIAYCTSYTVLPLQGPGVEVRSGAWADAELVVQRPGAAPLGGS